MKTLLTSYILSAQDASPTYSSNFILGRCIPADAVQQSTRHILTGDVGSDPSGFWKKMGSAHSKKTALRVQLSRTPNIIIQCVRAYTLTYYIICMYIYITKPWRTKNAPSQLPCTLSCDMNTTTPAAAHYTLYPSLYSISNSRRRRTVRRCNERILHTHYKRSISHARAKIRRIIIPLDRGDVQIILYYIIIRVFVVCASDARVYVCVPVCVQRVTRKTRPIVRCRRPKNHFIYNTRLLLCAYTIPYT